MQKFLQSNGHTHKKNVLSAQLFFPLSCQLFLFEFNPPSYILSTKFLTNASRVASSSFANLSHPVGTKWDTHQPSDQTLKGGRASSSPLFFRKACVTVDRSKLNFSINCRMILMAAPTSGAETFLFFLIRLCFWVFLRRGWIIITHCYVYFKIRTLGPPRQSEE